MQRTLSTAIVKALAAVVVQPLMMLNNRVLGVIKVTRVVTVLLEPLLLLTNVKRVLSWMTTTLFLEVAFAFVFLDFAEAMSPSGFHFLL